MSDLGRRVAAHMSIDWLRSRPAVGPPGRSWRRVQAAPPAPGAGVLRRAGVLLLIECEVHAVQECFEGLLELGLGVVFG